MTHFLVISFYDSKEIHFYFWNERCLMQFFLLLQKVKRNESTREENNAYFDTSLATAPKSIEPWYCNKNVATPKATDFNDQPGFVQT